jgi:hypothetical protein
MTRSVCQLAATTLELLTEDLQPGEHFELRDRAGVHMTLHVERLADVSDRSCFIVAHRHPGRVPVPDPEVALLRETDGRWTPVSIALPLSRFVTAHMNGSVFAGRRDEHRRLLKLVDVWMHNVRVHLLKRGVAENQEIVAPVAYAAQ